MGSQAGRERERTRSVWLGSQRISDLTTLHTMMGRAKLLGAELLGSNIKKDKAGKQSPEITDTKALKEALKLAKHKDLKQIDPKYWTMLHPKFKQDLEAGKPDRT